VSVQERRHPGAWPPDVPLFSPHILPPPLIERAVAHEALEGSSLPLQGPEALGLGTAHAPTLAPPPLHGLFGNILLATDVAHGSQRRRFVQKPNALFFRKPFTLQTSSR
jgi:hypothetical protein